MKTMHRRNRTPDLNGTESRSRKVCYNRRLEDVENRKAMVELQGHMFRSHLEPNPT
jgi:hypothetical protein